MLLPRPLGAANKIFLSVYSFSDVDDSIHHRLPSSSSLDVIIGVDEPEEGLRERKTMARANPWTMTNNYDKFNNNNNNTNNTDYDEGW